MAGYKTVNLEAGMPTSDQAVRRLTAEMATSRRSYAALKLIHGYGSSGTGGRTRARLAACPELRKEPDLERHNNGVTYILL